MREKDIILSACGVGEYGEPKGCVTVNFARWHMEEQREEVVKRLFTNEPVINITRTPRLTMVDLTFEMGEDSDFHELLEFLRMSSEPENSFDREEDVMPTLYVTIMPYIYEMEYFLTGLHGVWCLMPSVADGEIDTVRLIFNNELFSVYQVDGEVLDELQEAYLNERNIEDVGDSGDYGDEIPENDEAYGDCMDCTDYAAEVSENDEDYEDYLDYADEVSGNNEAYEDYTDYGDLGDEDLETDEDTGNRALEKKLDAAMTRKQAEDLDEDIWRD